MSLQRARKDWVYEVFEEPLPKGRQQLRVVLNTPSGMFSRLFSVNPGKMRSFDRGMGSGRRQACFAFSGGDVREYYLIKRGPLCLSNLHGSNMTVSILLRETKAFSQGILPCFDFIDAEEVFVRGGGIERNLKGQWKWASGRVVVLVELPPGEGAEAKGQSSESYKYFLRWSDDAAGELELEKMVILRPFLKEDRSKRQSWMSSLIFPESPRLKPN